VGVGVSLGDVDVLCLLKFTSIEVSQRTTQDRLPLRIGQTKMILLFFRSLQKTMEFLEGGEIDKLNGNVFSLYNFV